MAEELSSAPSGRLHPLVRRFFSSSRVRRWLFLRDVVPMSARQLQIWQEHAEEKANHYMTCNAPDMEEYYRGEADCLKKLARLWTEHGRWTSANNQRQATASKKP